MVANAPTADGGTARDAILCSAAALARTHIDLQEKWWDQHDRHRQVRDLTYPEAVFATDRALKPFLELRPQRVTLPGQSVCPATLDIPRLRADLAAATLPEHRVSRTPLSTHMNSSRTIPQPLASVPGSDRYPSLAGPVSAVCDYPDFGLHSVCSAAACPATPAPGGLARPTVTPTQTRPPPFGPMIPRD